MAHVDFRETCFNVCEWYCSISRNTVAKLSIAPLAIPKKKKKKEENVEKTRSIKTNEK